MDFSALPQKGFTLIELLLVIAIITVISGAMLPGFSNYVDNQNVRQAREQVKSDLRSVQNNAMSGVGSGTNINYWGVRINPNSKTYGYFKSQNVGGCGSATILETSDSLPGDVVTKNSGQICVYFSFANGDVAFYEAGSSVSCGTDALGNCDIAVGNDTSSTCDLIGLNTYGLIRTKGDSVACP